MEDYNIKSKCKGKLGKHLATKCPADFIFSPMKLKDIIIEKIVENVT